MRPEMPARAEAGARVTGSRPRTPQSPDPGRHGVRRILPQCAQRTSPPLTEQRAADAPHATWTFLGQSTSRTLGGRTPHAPATGGLSPSCLPATVWPGRDLCRGTRRRGGGPARAGAAEPGLGLRSCSRWPSWSRVKARRCHRTPGPREPAPRLPEVGLCPMDVAVGKKTPVTNNNVPCKPDGHDWVTGDAKTPMPSAWAGGPLVCLPSMLNT